MLRDVESSAEGSAEWTSGGASGLEPLRAQETRTSGRGSPNDWRTVDRALRSIAKRRAALDAEEADWLRKAEAFEIWKRRGAVSMIDYLERVLGYAPRTGQDRLRVARALGALPQLTAALACGDLTFSAVRELSRVATPATEADWRDAAIGKTARDVEELVADHRPGDRPDDPPVPEVRMRAVRFELWPDTFALLRHARTVLDDEHGRHLDDDEFIAALCGAVLDGEVTADPTGRARFQIAVTLCERCRQGWQDGGGVRVPIAADAVERALCDAQHIGSVDGHVAERAYQDIPPSIARLVWHRDGGRCRVPGCRSARHLELHHIVHRADGGTHDAFNLMLCCSACHKSHHAGLLSISGTAERLEVRRLDGASGSAMSRREESGALVNASMSTPPDQESCAHVSTSVSAPPDQESCAHVSKSVSAPRGPESCAHVSTSVSAPRGQEISAHVSTMVSARSRSQETGAHVSTSVSAPPDQETGAHVSTSVSAPRGQGTRAHVNASGSTPSRRQESCARVRTSSDHGIMVDPPGSAGSRDKLSAAVRREEVKAALLGLGWKPAIARAALVEAIAALDVEATFDQLLREALRRCPKPSVTMARDG
jgi:hypothetical protein